MIIPQYWAEARAQEKQRGKQITVRRFGWSDTSQEEAQANADQRCDEALRQILSGVKLERREPKIAYNGAVGLPIREEIISRHGDTIISRNSYGALCLNTPDVLFIDIDYAESTPFKFTLGILAILALCAIYFAYLTNSTSIGISLAIVSVLLCYPLASFFYWFFIKIKGGLDRINLERIDRFLLQHPEWNLRLYKTPAGMRALVTHRAFAPDDPAVDECFNALGADPMYARMCQNQQCFRARVSPKPWRIGISDHMRPRSGNWPVSPERLPMRNDWISKYETAATAYAACKFICSKGSGNMHIDVAKVVELHDKMCKASSDLPIA